MPTPITFTFTDEERRAAMEEGARRQRVNEEKGLRGRNNGPRFGKKALDVHLLGAAGEMAVASYLGLKHELFKETEAKRGSCDLPGIDVKTRSKHCRDLIVQKRESPDKALCAGNHRERNHIDSRVVQRRRRNEGGILG
jgi:hypothetical protein